MTKAIRIENADTSSWKVVVQVFDQKVAGVCDPANDTLAKTVNLDHPTSMAGVLGDVYLTSTRYVVVKEAAAAT